MILDVIAILLLAIVLCVWVIYDTIKQTRK